MQAFPKDSLNNSIGGTGPLNARPDHATFMGNAGDEAFKDYNSGAYKNGYNYSSGEMPVFDPMSRGSILHGDETLGLGTSTFLEGTPAARTAIQRREQEQQQQSIADGLQRKKSLAQRIRSINKGPRDSNTSGRMTNPEGVYNSRRSPDAIPPATTMPAFAGERNPFFDEFSKEPESISVKRADTIDAGPASPTSPGAPPKRTSGGLERHATTEATPTSPSGEESPAKPSGGGLLARVKSLKGGRKPRVSDAANNPPPPGPAV
jgi:Pal1 cell morphology protein